MIVIVDYGMGNLAAVRNMLAKIGVPAAVSSDPLEIMQAQKLILPGVGAFDSAVTNLEQRGLRDVLNTMVLTRRTPVLGICLGMQLMTSSSEEGKLRGLGWIDAQTVRFQLEALEKRYPVPHMGWNTVKQARPHPLFPDSDEEQRFYFVHSYYVRCVHSGDVLTKTMYGHEFVSGFQRDNIAGFQFHPEKSHKYGMRLLKNFNERF